MMSTFWLLGDSHRGASDVSIDHQRNDKENPVTPSGWFYSLANRIFCRYTAESSYPKFRGSDNAIGDERVLGRPLGAGNKYRSLPSATGTGAPH